MVLRRSQPTDHGRSIRSHPCASCGKVCYVVFTAESDIAPHFLNGRKGVWVRTDEFTSRFEARMANETARYKYVSWPQTLIKVSSTRQLPSTGRSKRRQRFSHVSA